jgi:two-component sensor histidine kinase
VGVLVSLGWIAPAILAAINEVAQQRFSGEAVIDVRPLLFAGVDWLVYGLITPAVFMISRRWPIGSHGGVRTIGVHAFMSLAFCAVWAAVGTVLRAVIMPDALWGGGWEHFIRWFFVTLPFGVALYFAMVGVDRAIHFFVETRDRELQMARLSEQLASARFASLQAQVNPHFLFNTLNTIAVLIKDVDTTGAARMVEQLSEMLRYTLSAERRAQVSLDEELALVRQYLAIQQARFSDRLQVTIAVDEDVRMAAVPSFSIQHLVENAIRHGVSKDADAGRVSIIARRFGERLSVTVVDDGPGFDDGGRGPGGHGLENTRQRLRLLYGLAASLQVRRVDANGTAATLVIPLRSVPATEER